jgi:hypothetical protein
MVHYQFPPVFVANVDDAMHKTAPKLFILPPNS